MLYSPSLRLLFILTSLLPPHTICSHFFLLLFLLTVIFFLGSSPFTSLTASSLHFFLLNTFSSILASTLPPHLFLPFPSSTTLLAPFALPPSCFSTVLTNKPIHNIIHTITKSLLDSRPWERHNHTTDRLRGVKKRKRDARKRRRRFCSLCSQNLNS